MENNHSASKIKELQANSAKNLAQKKEKALSKNSSEKPKNPVKKAIAAGMLIAGLGTAGVFAKEPVTKVVNDFGNKLVSRQQRYQDCRDSNPNKSENDYKNLCK
jgi:hypothetical protein